MASKPPAPSTPQTGGSPPKPKLEIERDEEPSLIAEYTDRSQWARHYSTVRMTVTLTLVTIGAAVMAARWDEPRLASILGVGAAGIVALVLFYVFSRARDKQWNAVTELAKGFTWRKMNQGYYDEFLGGEIPSRQSNRWSLTTVSGLLGIVAYLLVVAAWACDLKSKKPTDQCKHCSAHKVKPDEDSDKFETLRIQSPHARTGAD